MSEKLPPSPHYVDRETYWRERSLRVLPGMLQQGLHCLVRTTEAEGGEVPDDTFAQDNNARVAMRRAAEGGYHVRFVTTDTAVGDDRVLECLCSKEGLLMHNPDAGPGEPIKELPLVEIGYVVGLSHDWDGAFARMHTDFQNETYGHMRQGSMA